MLSVFLYIIFIIIINNKSDEIEILKIRMTVRQCQ
jgi:hypothetical protein